MTDARTRRAQKRRSRKRLDRWREAHQHDLRCDYCNRRMRRYWCMLNAAPYWCDRCHERIYLRTRTPPVTLEQELASMQRIMGAAP